MKTFAVLLIALGMLCTSTHGFWHEETTTQAPPHGWGGWSGWGWPQQPQQPIIIPIILGHRHAGAGYGHPPASPAHAPAPAPYGRR